MTQTTREVEQRVHPIKVILRNRFPRMSQAQLARRLDMNEAVLSRYLTGKSTPPDGFYTAVARELEVTVSKVRPAAEPEGAVA
jgi:transcriptional regulator with XRE-family HTH domain